MTPVLPSLLGFSREKLAAALRELGESKDFRTTQLLEWIWKKRATDFKQMSDLPPRLRASLGQHYSLLPLELVHRHDSVSDSATCKLLYRLHSDGELIESVLIPATVGRDGEHSNRITLCVSSQVGCAFRCRFCASGLYGLKRSLNAAELIGQIFAAEQLISHRIDNLVFMGMGEPLANVDNLLSALLLITSPKGIGIGARHITISTSGYIPGIARLAESGLPVRLAVSLHGATDDVRSDIMPINRKWPLSRLIPALESWCRTSKHILTLEYILIAGINDSAAQADALVSIAHRLRAKVNLIPYNHVEGLPWHRPSADACSHFRRFLIARSVPTTLRYEKGFDINAACGQLRRHNLSPQTHSAAKHTR